jgi:predicted phage terminase large subunit-like protein
MTKQALKKCLEGTKDERVFLCEHSFGLFAIYYFSNYFKYALAPYHYEMAQDLQDLLDGKIRECAWIMYRESAKTTFAKLFVIWCIAYKKKKYINVDSFDKENAERILFDVAFELTNNKKIAADFPTLFSKRRGIEDIKQNRINNFVTENGIRVEAHSTQESVRGRIHLDQRPDMLIADDIETNKTKDSEAYTKQVRDHISEALAGMSPDGNILYLGNYITEAGNIQFLLDRAKDDHKLRIRNVPVMDAKGVPAWGAKYAVTDVEAEETGKVSIEDKQRQLGSLVFSYEMMNQPIDDSLSEFKKEFETTITQQEVDRMNTRRFVTIDTAISKADSADYTGITVNYVNSENKWHLKAFRVKYNPKELIDFLFTIWKSLSPETIGIEKTIYLQAIKPFLDDEMRKRGVFLHITELNHNQTAKETRVRGLIPRWEAGSIILIENECQDLVSEMRVFPRGQHDDVIDSTQYQLQVATPPEQSFDYDKFEEEEMKSSALMYK